MGLTSSLITGLSGLSANQSMLSVTGNNISNVNTVGYKASRLDFQNQFSQTFTYGSAPNGDLGGTNPYQVGLGTKEATVSKNFADGSREVTGVNTQLSIEGNGFFVLHDSQTSFTRDGTFKLNSQNKLVNGDGLYVQGYGVDSNFTPVPGVLQDITIPLGELTIAKPTTNATLDGNLNASGSLPTHASNITSTPLYSFAAGGGSTPSATPPAGTDALTSLASAANVPLFHTGDVITVSGTKGSHSVAPKTLTVAAGTTVNDYLSFMQGALAINTTTGANGSVADTPVGASLQAGPTSNSSALQIIGNVGKDNDITLTSTSVSVALAGGGTSTPLGFNKTRSADGESVFTSMTAYDSLGTPVTVNVTAALTGTGPSGTTWQFYADSPDNTSTGAALNEIAGGGTLSFNNSGTLTNVSNPNITVDRTGTGATPNLTYAFDFTKVTALSGNKSQLANTLQDGQPKGTLSSFAIGADGSINGTFSNGLTHTLGQVAIATFRNNGGLVDSGNNTYLPGPNSGIAVIAPPQTLNAGKIVAGSLELSNVDLSGEFVKLISASTGFSAASRVITTSNQLLQDLLTVGR